MSHFFTLVIYKADPGQDPEQVIEDLLAPFDENRRMPPHEIKCWCIGRKAENDAEKALAAKAGTWDDARTAYHSRPGYEKMSEEQREATWKKQYWAPRQKFLKAQIAKHPLKGKPDPACEECKGSGKETTTCNDDAKWDWWTVGGRWTGSLTKYDPSTDPKNWETCSLCSGTGTRPNGEKEFGKEWMKETKGCNGCHGTGKSLKFSYVPFIGDWTQVSEIYPDVFPYAIVTPNGAWYQKGEMGWFGISNNEKAESTWRKQVRDLYKRYRDFDCVVVDCHI